MIPRQPLLAGLGVTVGKSIKRFVEPQTITNKKAKEGIFYLCVSEDSVTFASYQPHNRGFFEGIE